MATRGDAASASSWASRPRGHDHRTVDDGAGRRGVVEHLPLERVELGRRRARHAQARRPSPASIARCRPCSAPSPRASVPHSVARTSSTGSGRPASRNVWRSCRPMSMRPPAACDDGQHHVQQTLVGGRSRPRVPAGAERGEVRFHHGHRRRPGARTSARMRQRAAPDRAGASARSGPTTASTGASVERVEFRLDEGDMGEAPRRCPPTRRGHGRGRAVHAHHLPRPGPPARPRAG